MSPPKADTRLRPFDAGTIFLALLALRIANALTLRTFFQPDEYYQVLEPAWQIAFGQESGAWITWEWHNRLRSSLHPAIFACIYAFLDAMCKILHSPVASRSEVLVLGPRIVQAIFAGITDWCTWRLARNLYKTSFAEASWATLALTICSPWQWFCSTRTFSNSLEATLTVSALSLWPWHVINAQRKNGQLTPSAQGVHADETPSLDKSKNLRYSLGLAALACILRPTNIIIWVCVFIPTLLCIDHRSKFVLLSQSVTCGMVILLVSVISDRVYYDTWTFPPLRFLIFNVTKSLAVFYGKNRIDYYLTEGFPLLLTTALPFAVTGMWGALFKQDFCSSTAGETKRLEKAQSREHLKIRGSGGHSGINRNAIRILAWTCVIVPLVLSCIAHKEVRFVYPTLPLLHVLAGGPLASFAATSSLISPSLAVPPQSSRKSVSVIIIMLVAMNVFLSYYVSQVHQRGVIDVMHQLRRMHESRLAEIDKYPSSGLNHRSASTTTASEYGDVITSFAVLMPCHSTPWRSHLVHPNLRGWALTCEPPVDIPLEERMNYLDEADQFYANPVAWLQDNMYKNAIDPRDRKTVADPEVDGNTPEEAEPMGWPSMFIMFAQLEDTLSQTLQQEGYQRCWRAFNTHWHDDWRRNGDVVIWCLTDP